MRAIPEKKNYVQCLQQVADRDCGHARKRAAKLHVERLDDQTFELPTNISFRRCRLNCADTADGLHHLRISFCLFLKCLAILPLEDRRHHQSQYDVTRNEDEREESQLNVVEKHQAEVDED